LIRPSLERGHLFVLQEKHQDSLDTQRRELDAWAALILSIGEALKSKPERIGFTNAVEKEADHLPTPSTVFDWNVLPDRVELVERVRRFQQTYAALAEKKTCSLACKAQHRAAWLPKLDPQVPIFIR
jgi:hypothetical protein